MATTTRGRLNKSQSVNSKLDFSKVGGLDSHLKLLREIIILPLIHGKVYTHFDIKAPRGILFYGPPGTGKTLVAGALANEINQESCGKVTFYHRKGADILDKWVGESEKKLRELFDKAIRSRPSIIFFDEIDGLAPVRTRRNEQVHASVVSTLLALMDGLDNKNGVIVIGATNRIESIDPALRRPGRFDRELFFPLPCLNSRIEILQVHIKNWKNKPKTDFLYHLAERTSGYCGSDLQALCAESVLCSLKRTYPNINTKSKINIDLETIKIEEIDFLEAQINITPASQRFGNCRRRQLCSFIKPLLQRQLNIILSQIQQLLPHFIEYQKKFIVGFERYAGRLLLKGHLHQGINSHIVPAILQRLEHIPSYVVDIPMRYQEMFNCAVCNLPSIFVLLRVDEWWEMIDNSSQLAIASSLDEIHAGLPILVIVTCSSSLPQILEQYFNDNCSIVVQVKDPTAEEREHFFASLFFAKDTRSIYTVWEDSKLTHHKEIKQENLMLPPVKEPIKNKLNRVISGKIEKPTHERIVQNGCKDLRINCSCHLKNIGKAIMSTKAKEVLSLNDLKSKKNLDNSCSTTRVIPSESQLQTLYMNKIIKPEKSGSVQNESCQSARKLFCPTEIFTTWKKVSNSTGGGLSIVPLELLFDSIQGCINVYKDDFNDLMENLQETVKKFEEREKHN